VRIGVIGLLHESNTFAQPPTTVDQFRAGTLLEGEAIIEQFADAHHELGGFVAELQNASGEGVQTAPIFAARALPSGGVTAEAYEELVGRMLARVEESEPLDGLLVAPHGATVSEEYRDADGEWLRRLRKQVGNVPIVGTLDAHANLSPAMVENCNALIAYRTNPHLDQRQRGRQAAALLMQVVRGEIEPKMAAVLPPMAINIEKQCTDEDHLRPLYALADQQLKNSLLSNSVLLGFPYSDVSEMGSSVIAVAKSNDEAAASALELAERMWRDRREFVGEFVSPAEAVARCLAATDDAPTCLLDMGDNVGGGSAADGTMLFEEMHSRKIPNCFVCLVDPGAVAICLEQINQHGDDARIRIAVGGNTDQLHGSPLDVDATVVSKHDGRFSETKPRHGGMTHFDQGETVVLRTDYGATIMLTSRRMTPFSLQQLTSCGIDPSEFRMIIAKGVNAPLAAYREVCNNFIRVNTQGSTCADMLQLSYQHRREPLFPFDDELIWEPTEQHLIRGFMTS